MHVFDLALKLALQTETSEQWCGHICPPYLWIGKAASEIVYFPVKKWGKSSYFAAQMGFRTRFAA
jgi:hypothetical protein